MGEVDEELEELLEEESYDDEPESELTVESLDQVVDEVRRGLWGKGHARRLALAQAGHDPNVVQRALVERSNGR